MLNVIFEWEISVSCGSYVGHTACVRIYDHMCVCEVQRWVLVGVCSGKISLNSEKLMDACGCSGVTLMKRGRGVTRVVQPHPAAEDLDTPLFDSKIFWLMSARYPVPKLSVRYNKESCFIISELQEAKCPSARKERGDPTDGDSRKCSEDAGPQNGGCQSEFKVRLTC